MTIETTTTRRGAYGLMLSCHTPNIAMSASDLDRMDRLAFAAAKLLSHHRCDRCDREGTANGINVYLVIASDCLATRWDMANHVALCRGCSALRSQEGEDAFRRWFVTKFGELRSRHLQAAQKATTAPDVAAIRSRLQRILAGEA